jgi:hypothetical protein
LSNDVAILHYVDELTLGTSSRSYCKQDIDRAKHKSFVSSRQLREGFIEHVPQSGMCFAHGVLWLQDTLHTNRPWSFEGYGIVTHRSRASNTHDINARSEHLKGAWKGSCGRLVEEMYSDLLVVILRIPRREHTTPPYKPARVLEAFDICFRNALGFAYSLSNACVYGL